MTSQAATRVLRVGDIAEGSSTVTCDLELACGCVVTRDVARDRLLMLAGERRAVGKYPCPEGHPAGFTRA